MLVCINYSIVLIAIFLLIPCLIINNQQSSLIHSSNNNLYICSIFITNRMTLINLIISPIISKELFPQFLKTNFLCTKRPSSNTNLVFILRMQAASLNMNLISRKVWNCNSSHTLQTTIFTSSITRALSKSDIMRDLSKQL